MFRECRLICAQQDYQQLQDNSVLKFTDLLSSTNIRRPHSTNQKVVQGKCPLHFVEFNGVVSSNTLFSNTSVLTNSLLSRANSTCKGSRDTSFGRTLLRSSGGVQVRFRVRFQAVKVPSWGKIPS